MDPELWQVAFHPHCPPAVLHAVGHWLATFGDGADQPMASENDLN